MSQYIVTGKGDGTVQVVMRDGKTHALNFNTPGGAFVLEAVLEAIHGAGKLEGFREARVIATTGEEEVAA
jgi:hypothetical protein